MSSAGKVSCSRKKKPVRGGGTYNSTASPSKNAAVLGRKKAWGEEMGGSMSRAERGGRESSQRVSDVPKKGHRHHRGGVQLKKEEPARSGHVQESERKSGDVEGDFLKAS